MDESGTMTTATTSRDVWRIRKDGRGMRGFLDPPGHPNHEYVLLGYWSRDGKAVNVGARNRGNGADYHGSIEGAQGDEADRSGIPQGVRDQAARIMAAAPLVCSELWVRMVYGYFRGSYAPESGDRDVSKAIMAASTCQCGEYCLTANGLEKHLSDHAYGHGRLNLPPERHLAYLKVRSHFPDHEPRIDLIRYPGHGYGSYPCVKCDQRVQYEPRCDALSVFGSHDAGQCPEGGKHETDAG